jgi:predicted O-methyltransferase YrrM
VLEIGTYMGHTARQMVENLETATIHTVDLPETFCAERDAQQSLPKDDFHLIERRVVGREFKGHSCANRITQHFADTATSG